MSGIDVEENTGSELRKILKKYRPSQLDEQFTTACPFYEPKETGFSSAYSWIHDVAKCLILVKLQEKLNEISVVSELPLEFGRVDGAAGNSIVLKGGNGDIFMLIEVKTGSVKLVQPSIYTLSKRTKTLVAELKTGDVLKIDVDTARVIAEKLLEHMKAKEALRKAGKKIPGSECRRCVADCEFRKTVNWNGNPLKSLEEVMRNIDAVVNKIAAEIAREVEKRGKRVAVAAGA